MSEREAPIIGHVVGDDEDAVMVCVECYEGDSDGGIRDNDAYGDRVPYPECYVCGEVLRPDRVTQD